MMALTIIFGVLSFITGSVLTTWLIRDHERHLFLAELLTGEIQIDGWSFKVQASEFPHKEATQRVHV